MFWYILIPDLVLRIQFPRSGRYRATEARMTVCPGSK